MSYGAAKITVFCDGPCRNTRGASVAEIELTETAHGWDARYVEDELRDRGWIIDSSGSTYCDTCAIEMGLKEE